jgi:3D (Asp-Asp-Asp) domain-containing protein
LDGKLRLGLLLILFIPWGPVSVCTADENNSSYKEGKQDVLRIIQGGVYQVVGETIRVVTAYNAGDPRQTDGDPCTSANGENICDALKAGERRCAANFVPFGTVLYIDKYGVCQVTDRMSRRYRNRVDIAMKSDESTKAREFGKQKLSVKILKKITADSQPFHYNSEKKRNL